MSSSILAVCGCRGRVGKDAKPAVVCAMWCVSAPQTRRQPLTLHTLARLQHARANAFALPCVTHLRSARSAGRSARSTCSRRPTMLPELLQLRSMPVRLGAYWPRSHLVCSSLARLLTAPGSAETVDRFRSSFRLEPSSVSSFSHRTDVSGLTLWLYYHAPLIGTTHYGFWLKKRRTRRFPVAHLPPRIYPPRPRLRMTRRCKQLCQKLAFDAVQVRPGFSARRRPTRPMLTRIAQLQEAFILSGLSTDAQLPPGDSLPELFLSGLLEAQLLAPDSKNPEPLNRWDP